MKSRERVVSLIKGQTVDCLPFMPITMTFAADRIGARYYDYATNYRILAEAQLRTAEEFDFDYVSAISDPAREAADCGGAVIYAENQPPDLDQSHSRLADKTELARLAIPDPLGGGRMHDRVRAVALLKEKAGENKLVEGWVEGPCAEGADLRGINTIMMDFYEDPIFLRDLFEFVVEMELRFAKAQADAGADLIGVGDAAASLLSPSLYEEFVWPFQKRMVEGIQAMGAMVRLHICGNTRHILEGMGRLGCEIVDLDYLSPLSEGREKMGPDQVLLGNLDPVKVLRDGTPETVRTAVEECHRQAGTRFIVGAGCEVTRDTPLENLRAMHDYARSH
ncbi:MAG: hypothetical protein C4527_18990 [Candidatus Omnitrophota bacterium]|jgi:MtaA/CmuA family methyltransferase|nr:MAG: hypothetical protein C4527_18990 [Candidatus Omnitrophota bacterium]